MTRSAHDEAVEAAVAAFGPRMDEVLHEALHGDAGGSDVTPAVLAAITAYLRHMRAAGFVQMPAEATEAMETACIKASLAFLIAHKIKAIWPWSRNRSHVRENIRVCYRAMVRAVEVPE